MTAKEAVSKRRTDVIAPKDYRVLKYDCAKAEVALSDDKQAIMGEASWHPSVSLSWRGLSVESIWALFKHSVAVSSITASAVRHNARPPITHDWLIAHLMQLH